MKESLGMKNLLIIPSHKRPNKLQTCLDSVLKNSSCSDIFVILNHEDAESYSNIIKKYAIANVRFMFTNKNTCPDKLNHVCDLYGENYDFVSFIGDDCVVTTPNWDAICANYINNHFSGLGVVSPSEPSWGRNYDDLPLHWMQSKSFWKTVGYFVHRGMKHCYVDNIIRDFAKSIDGYAKIPACIVEHHHPNHGFENDEVYDEGEKKHCEDDKRVYNQFLNSPEYFETLKRLQEAKINVQ